MRLFSESRRRHLLLGTVAAVAVAASGALLRYQSLQRNKVAVASAALVFQAVPAALARWPWPDAQPAAPHRGVTHWFARSADGTTVDLLQFNFRANSGLRFELYDLDEDDASPFDNVRLRLSTRGQGQGLAPTGSSVGTRPAASANMPGARHSLEPPIEASLHRRAFAPRQNLAEAVMLQRTEQHVATQL